MKSKMYLRYSLKEFGEGLFGLEHRRYGRQIWSLAKVRKQHKCVLTGQMIEKGEQAYLPITNAGNRYERISQAFFEAKDGR